MTTSPESFIQSVTDLDYESAEKAITDALRRHAGRTLKRRGIVVAVSGGIDSSVCAALAVRAVGPERVFGLLMPEHDSDPDSTRRGKMLCEALGIEYVLEDIGPALEALGCYRRRDDAIRRLFPEYGPGYKQKITVADGLLDDDRLNFFNLVIQSPDGEMKKERMPADVYLEVVAATNMKQRTRKQLEYFHADRLNFAVLGTPNRLEYELGFFVRGGDGLADIKPIAHLYKTQVYGMAAHLDLPRDIQDQTPSTDTYSLPQTQEEFYYALPHDQMDLLLAAYDQKVSAEDAARAMALETAQVERVYRDITGKKRMAQRLMTDALFVTNEVKMAPLDGSGSSAA